MAGVQDIAQASLDRIAQSHDLDGIPTFLDFREALEASSPDAVLMAPVAEAHAAAALTAIEAGCHVLIEKPMATALSDAFQVVNAAEKRGVVVGVVQNWRAKSVGLALREAIGSGRIGRVGNVFFRYVRDREQPHLPAYLFDEPYPLLYAMAIHHFDLFRFALGENIVAVEGRPFTPPWSRYKSPPGVQLWMQTESGVPISYVGTFSSTNRHIAQENLIVEGAAGSISNESRWGEPPLLFSGRGDQQPVDLTAGEPVGVREQYDRADERYLEDFYGPSDSAERHFAQPRITSGPSRPSRRRGARVKPDTRWMSDSSSGR